MILIPVIMQSDNAQISINTSNKTTKNQKLSEIAFLNKKLLLIKICQLLALYFLSKTFYVNRRPHICIVLLVMVIGFCQQGLSDGNFS